MRKLPETVQVGAETYKLIRTDRVDFKRLYGETSSAKLEIRFGVLVDGARLPGTLIHELIHAVATEYGADFEENEITALASGLTQALQSLEILPKELILHDE